MIVAGIGLVVALLAAMARKQQRDGDRGAERPTMWDKMRQGMEEMPEDFPPRIMYDNVETTRANTERILEILQDKGDSEQAADDESKSNV